NGTAVYTTSFTTSGPHQLIAIYSGDSTHATSNGVVTVNVPSVNSGTGSFALAATPLSVTAGGSGSSTITVTPSGGYTGTVLLSFSTSNATALKNLCWKFTSSNSSGDGTVVIDGTAAASTQLTLDANAADCNAGALRSGTGKRAFAALQPIHNSGIPGSRGIPLIPALLALASLLLMCLGGGFRRYRAWAGFMVLIAVGFTAVGCGGSNSSSTTVTNPPPGTYTITVTGQDSATSTISATTQFAYTIQ
ncbi:MAG TPA: hypothetical protein VNE83_06475, partial [Terriglobales bacterium]|nr:hypothetical protein [Terriglobales bacterium]